MTQHLETEADRPPTKPPDEIEITDAMIDAGERALLEIGCQDNDPGACALAAFRAMRKAEKRAYVTMTEVTDEMRIVFQAAFDPSICETTYYRQAVEALSKERRRNDQSSEIGRPG
jgi:hypothetical protein